MNDMSLIYPAKITSTKVLYLVPFDNHMTLMEKLPAIIPAGGEL